jgi:hypothetical protein
MSESLDWGLIRWKSFIHNSQYGVKHIQVKNNALVDQLRRLRIEVAKIGMEREEHSYSINAL